MKLGFLNKWHSNTQEMKVLKKTYWTSSSVQPGNPDFLSVEIMKQQPNILRVKKLLFKTQISVTVGAACNIGLAREIGF